MPPLFTLHKLALRINFVLIYLSETIIALNPAFVAEFSHWLFFTEILIVNFNPLFKNANSRNRRLANLSNSKTVVSENFRSWYKVDARNIYLFYQCIFKSSGVVPRLQDCS